MPLLGLGPPKKKVCEVGASLSRLARSRGLVLALGARLGGTTCNKHPADRISSQEQDASEQREKLIRAVPVMWRLPGLLFGAARMRPALASSSCLIELCNVNAKTLLSCCYQQR